MIHSSISLAVHVVLVFVLLKFSALGIYAVVIGNATFPILIFILNLRTLYQEIDYISVFAKPGISALVMGVFTWLSYKGMYTLTSSNVLALVIAFMVALITYFGPYYALTKMRVFE